jgi:hypothetical protein
MRLRTRLVLAIILVAIVFLSTLVFALASKTFLFSKELMVEEIRYDPSMNSYSTSLTDNGVLVANVYFRIDNALANSLGHRMIFSISPHNQTEVDSLTLKFSGVHGVISVYYEANSIFQDTSFNERNNEVVLKIPDAGLYGSSTIRLDFILEPFGAESLSLIAELTMHKNTPLQLTSQKAQLHIDAAIPKAVVDQSLVGSS